MVADFFAKVPSVFSDSGCEDQCISVAAKDGEVAGDDFCHLVAEGFKGAQSAWRFWFCPKVADV